MSINKGCTHAHTSTFAGSGEMIGKQSYCQFVCEVISTHVYRLFYLLLTLIDGGGIS